MPRWPQRDPEPAGSRGARPLTEAERIGRRNGTTEASRHADARSARTRRDRPRDPHERRVPFEERKRLALDDLATYRAVSFRDLSDARFGGNDFAARRGISQMQEAGLVVRGKGWGPRGRPFLIFAATAAGTRAAAQRGPAGQRRWHGLVKPSEAHHDTAVYRAAREKIAELEGQGLQGCPHPDRRRAEERAGQGRRARPRRGRAGGRAGRATPRGAGAGPAGFRWEGARAGRADRVRAAC